jgi:hypothetical protein
MRGSAVLVVAAGLALAGSAFSLPAHAGVFSAAGHAKLNATSVVKVSWPPWWAAKLGYDVSAWRGLSRQERHDFQVAWWQARHAEKSGNSSLMNEVLAKYGSGTSSTSGATNSSTPNTGSTNSLLASISSTPTSFASATSSVDPTKRQSGGLPGSNYLALQSYGVTDFSGTIKLSSGLMTSWLEHSTLLAGFDSNGNVTFEPLKAGAHIISVMGGTNVQSISVGKNNAISFSLKDPSQNGDFSYVLQFADGSTRTVSGNPIFTNYLKIQGQNLVNNVTTKSFSIPFSEIFANFSNPSGNTLSIAGIGLKDGVSNLVIDTKNQVITGTLAGGGTLGRLGITVTDGKSASTITKTINLLTASPT